jgi:hypothetical protein
MCGAVMMAAFAAFSAWAGTQTAHGHAGWVVRTFAHMGIPPERHSEIWFFAAALHVGWLLVCCWMAFVADRAVKRQSKAAISVVAVCHCVSTIVVVGWGIAMANFVRVPLLLVAVLWVWAVWSYFGLAQSWRSKPEG